MDMVRVAVAGAGFWGRNHLRILQELEGCTIVGVCDIDATRAENAAKKYQIPKYFTDYDTLLDRTEPDAITICTPSTTHAELSLKAIERGISVLIEKPMATTIQDSIKIVDAKKSSNTVVMVGFLERFNPVVKAAKELLNKGEIGSIILSYSRRIGSWPERIGDVGVVKDTAIHDIDLTTYIFGSIPLQVYARGGSLRHRLEDHIQATLTFTNGRSALIEANWLTPRKKREMHITGDDGVISLKFIEQELTIEKADAVKMPMIRYSEPLRLELEHFIECVRSKREPLVGVGDGYTAELIAEAILHSAKTGKPVEVLSYEEEALTS